MLHLYVHDIFVSVVSSLHAILMKFQIKLRGLGWKKNSLLFPSDCHLYIWLGTDLILPKDAQEQPYTITAYTLTVCVCSSIRARMFPLLLNLHPFLFQIQRIWGSPTDLGVNGATGKPAFPGSNKRNPPLSHQDREGYCVLTNWPVQLEGLTTLNVVYNTT